MLIGELNVEVLVGASCIGSLFPLYFMSLCEGNHLLAAASYLADIWESDINVSSDS